MKQRFTLLIDESGDSGIAVVRSADRAKGASPYMTMGAALVSNDSLETVRDTLQRIAVDVGKKQLHCSELNHYQKIFFIREIAQHKKRLFGVLSYKDTLGNYKDTIEDDGKKYYNKCAQYLLERVGWFMEANSISPEQLDIVFEKGNFDYDRMKILLRKCQQKPAHSMTAGFCWEENRLRIAPQRPRSWHRCKSDQPIPRGRFSTVRDAKFIG